LPSATPSAKGAPPASGGSLSAAARAGQSTVVHGGIILRPRTGSTAADLFLGLLTFGIYAAVANDAAAERHHMLDDSWGRMLERRTDDGAPSPSWEQRRYGYLTERRHDAREGFLFSFGLGGGAVRFSDPNFARTGALNFGLRMGYGFSDRFQLFGDFTADAAFYSGSRELTNWLATLRGQTVLVGDTVGNGLNLNLGFGLGGVSINYGGFGPDISSAAAPALVAGLSYDARVGRQFALSPELYFSWHPVPNGRDVTGQALPDDQLWAAGLRLNFLWYNPVH
jgi:hypothetical protein